MARVNLVSTISNSYQKHHVAAVKGYKHSLINLSRNSKVLHYKYGNFVWSFLISAWKNSTARRFKLHCDNDNIQVNTSSVLFDGFGCKFLVKLKHLYYVTDRDISRSKCGIQFWQPFNRCLWLCNVKSTSQDMKHAQGTRVSFHYSKTHN